MQTLGWSESADPTTLTPSELVDLIVTTGRLIAHVQALQIGAIAEFARPGRCGDLQQLLAGLTEKVGLAHRADGTIDPERLAILAEEQAQRVATAEIAAALRQSHVGVARRVNEALELVDELPNTLAAVRDGRIDLARAAVIAGRTRNLQPSQRSTVEAQVIGLAQTRNPGQLTRMVDRRVLAIDPDAVNKRCRAARRERFVDHTPAPDGMGDIRAHLPAEDAVTVWDLLDRMARATAGQDERPLGVRRADALTDICTQLLTTGVCDLGGHADPENAPQDTSVGVAHVDDDRPETDPEEMGNSSATSVNDQPESHETAIAPIGSGAPIVNPLIRPTPPRTRLSKTNKHHGRGAHFVVSMTVGAFLGLSEDPAELDGHGVMPASFGRWMRRSLTSLAVVVVNSRGQTVAVGGTVYPPRQQFTDQVITAAGTCRFPSCRVPATTCDLDHRVPFDHASPDRGGATDPRNLDPLCENHHLLKTFTGWSAERDPDDGLSMRWSSPTGHTYLAPAREQTLPAEQQFDPHPAAETTHIYDVDPADDWNVEDWSVIRSEAERSTAHYLAEREASAPDSLEPQGSQPLRRSRPPQIVHLPPTVHLEYQPNWERKGPEESIAEYFARRMDPDRYQRNLTVKIEAALAAARPDPDRPPF